MAKRISKAARIAARIAAEVPSFGTGRMADNLLDRCFKKPAFALGVDIEMVVRRVLYLGGRPRRKAALR